MASTVEWLRDVVPPVDTASKVAAARLHMDEVEQISRLNTSCYGVGPVEAWGSSSASSQMMQALETANAAIGELRGRLASLEAEGLANAERAERAESRANRVREELVASHTAEQASLMQRIVVAEARASAAERAAAEAMAAARTATSASDHTDLVRRLAVLEARTELAERQPRGSASALEKNPEEEARLERTMARAERESVAVRSAVDELRSRLQRAEARADEEGVRADSVRERVARSEEHSLSLRSVLDAQTNELKLRLDDLANFNADERERTARLDQRLTSLQANHDDDHATVTQKMDAVQVDFTFFREHQVRLEEQVRTLLAHQQDDVLELNDPANDAFLSPAGSSSPGNNANPPS